MRHGFEKRFSALVLAVAVLTVAAGAAAAKARHALLIANQAYKPAIGPLENPANDVRLIAAALQKVGFAASDITIVTDAGRGAILRALVDHAATLASAGDDAIGFLYYSGHGVANPADKRNYLLPVDIDRLDSYLWTEAVSLERVVEILSDRASNAAHFVVFDACRNLLRLPVRGTKGFAPVAERRGMLIAFSTEPGATASDSGRLSGPYAAALAAELAKPGQSHLDLFQNVRERVWKQTRSQVPWTRDGLLQRVYLGGRRTGGGRPKMSSSATGSVAAHTQPNSGSADGPRQVPQRLARAGACTVIGRKIPRRIELTKGQRFCDKSGASNATVVKIANRLVIFEDNGVRKYCREGELCGFNWPSVPMFRISARADPIKGIAPRGVMMPR